MEQELLNRIEQLEKELQEIKQGKLTDPIIKSIVDAGFIKEIGPKIITYTNPSGKDFYSTFVELKNEINTVPLYETNYFVEIDSVNTNNNTLTINSHDFLDGNQVTVATTDIPPGGLNIQGIYYVINSTTNTLQLSTTFGGSATNITSVGSGIHYLNSF